MSHSVSYMRHFVNALSCVSKSHHEGVVDQISADVDSGLGRSWDLGEVCAWKILTPQIVLRIYIVLMVAGGLVGFFKTRSKASLNMSLVFGVALSLCAIGLTAYRHAPYILLTVLFFLVGASAKDASLCRAG
jgi:hypothetical protein